MSDKDAVEAVARAIVRSVPSYPDEDDICDGAPFWRCFEREARAALAAARPFIMEEAARHDYFGELVLRARAAAEKASRKFPQPNYVTLKIAEEAGEVVRGAVHYAEGRMEWQEVEGEVVQLLAMLIRFVTEGDQINGVTPPAAIRAAKEKGE